MEKKAGFVSKVNSAGQTSGSPSRSGEALRLPPCARDSRSDGRWTGQQK